jgi:hypothetical protein
MNITKEYDSAKGIVILTVYCDPLPVEKHTIVASALADGTVDLDVEIAKLTASAEEKLNVHNIVTGMIDG